MKTAAWMAGGLIAVCVAILLMDYALALRRGPRDDRLIKALLDGDQSVAVVASK